MDEKDAVNWSLQLLETQIGTNDDSFEEKRMQLVKVINELIHNDFNKLLTILYRIDVDENKLKFALLESTMPAAETISDLIIQRQLQKIKFRQMYRDRNEKKNN